MRVGLCLTLLRNDAGEDVRLGDEGGGYPKKSREKYEVVGTHNDRHAKLSP